MKINHVTISILHSFSFVSTYILPSIRSFCHVRNTRKDNYPICTKHAFSSHAKSITVICFIFICSFALSRAYDTYPLFLLLSFTLDSYTRSHSFFLSFSLPHFHSFLSLSLSLFLAHIHPFYAQKTDNIQFDISYMRKRTKTKFAHYVPSTYIITIYMYI